MRRRRKKEWDDRDRWYDTREYDEEAEEERMGEELYI